MPVDAIRLARYIVFRYSHIDVRGVAKNVGTRKNRAMKNYMNRWVLLALKAIVILVWLACLWGRLFAVPGLSGALAGLCPSQTSMHWSYLIMGGLFLLCVEAAFVAVWKLFSLSGSGANLSR